jgi:hypothetical protein
MLPTGSRGRSGEKQGDKMKKLPPIELATIKAELKDFEEETIDIIDGLPFSQTELIKNVIYYYNSKFLTGNEDDQGDRKYFLNINRNTCDVCEKAIDFDTKNINILTAKGGTELRTWFLERDLKYWMKDKNFGRVLNRIFHELPIFGSVVLKVVKGTPYFVDLRNFAVQQDADTLFDASYIIESHRYNALKFKKTAKENGWNNWEEALGDGKEVTVLERYGEDDDLNYRRTIVADNGTGTILADDIIETHPYWEFHLDKLPGRWLGVGRVELVLDPQVRVNEITNQQVKSSYFTSLRLWQSRDQGIKRNLLTDATNGEILQVEDPLQQVDMADRNLTFYETELNRWFNNKNELTFSHEPIRGEVEKGVTLGATQLASGMAGAYFGQVQENIALDVKEFLFQVVIPQFLKENGVKHNLRIVGEDLDKYNELLSRAKSNNEILAYILKNQRIPNKEQLEIIRGLVAEKIKKGKEKLIDIPAEYYKDLKYKIDIVITGEQLDTRAESANRLAILQAMTADPTLFTDPIKKKLMYPLLEAAGINPIDLNIEQAPKLEETIRGAGGGVSKMPNMPNPVAGQRELRI